MAPLGGTFDSGPRPLSEPESVSAHRLILRVRPAISIWFYQHLRVVDESGGDIHIERPFAQLVGLPFRRLPQYPGSAVGWENHRLPGTTSFVVELPAGSLTTAAAARYARAVLALNSYARSASDVAVPHRRVSPSTRPSATREARRTGLSASVRAES
jgi:murein peptide amidase A